MSEGQRQNRPGKAGREDHERDSSEPGADASFGSRAGRDDRLELADVVDPDGVEKHGDEIIGMGHIGEIAPNEANFEESVSSAEPQESIQVPASSGAFSGLDNGVAQPGEGGTPEEGEALGSGSESGGTKPPLKAGCCSLTEILAIALALPRSGSRDP